MVVRIQNVLKDILRPGCIKVDTSVWYFQPKLCFMIVQVFLEGFYQFLLEYFGVLVRWCVYGTAQCHFPHKVAEVRWNRRIRSSIKQEIISIQIVKRPIIYDCKSTDMGDDIKVKLKWMCVKTFLTASHQTDVRGLTMAVIKFKKVSRLKIVKNEFRTVFTNLNSDSHVIMNLPYF